MKKAYLAISYSNRSLFNNEVDCLKTAFAQHGIELLIFVDKYNFKPTEAQQMMQTAFKEIDSCDILVAELTTKSIGVGIVIGYAYANKKPIIYLRKQDAEYSTTAAGCATFNIDYKNVADLKQSVESTIKSLKL